MSADAMQGIPRAIRLFAAFAHPLRKDILEAFDRDVASPTDLAERLHQALPDVVYHVRRLAELGFVERVGRRPMRTGGHTYYRRVGLPYFEHRDFEPFGVAPRQAMVEMIGSSLVADALAAGRLARLDSADDPNLEHIAADVDQRGWDELDACVNEYLDDVQEIAERALARASANGGPTTAEPVFLHVLKFRAADASTS